MDSLFSRVCCNSTRSNSFELKEGGFSLDIRKKSFMLRVVKHWNKLPKEVADPWKHSQPSWTAL